MSAKCSEDVLLVVAHVKNKKCEGTLYMMSERMAWMPATRQTFTVTHNYVDIKSMYSCIIYLYLLTLRGASHKHKTGGASI